MTDIIPATYWPEPFFNELEQLEYLLDFAWRWRGMPPSWYEGDGPAALDLAYERAMYGDPED